MNNSQKSAVIISLLLATTIFLVVSINQLRDTYKTIFKDDFESFPSNWSIDTRGGTVTKSSIVKLDGSYYLCIYSPDVTNNAYTYTNITEISNSDFPFRYGSMSTTQLFPTIST
jgi:hypothetical protein